VNRICLFRVLASLAVTGLCGVAHPQAPGQPGGPPGVPRRGPVEPPPPQRFADISGPAGVFVHVVNGPHGVSMLDADGDPSGPRRGPSGSQRGGRLDIFVANWFSPNWLFLNQGNNTFIERGTEAGIAEAIKGTHSGAFFDMEGDGDYDLLMGNPSDETTLGFADESIDTLWRNDGKGHFEDVTKSSGFGRRSEITRGVVAADFDGDGDVDLYTTNPVAKGFLRETTRIEGTRNLHFNDGQGHFTAADPGFPYLGFVQGVTAGDVDGDGDVDLVEARWPVPTTLYLNDGKARFTDAGKERGLAHDASRDNGATLADIDTDGDLDLVVLGPQLRIYRNDGKGAFADATRQACPQGADTKGFTAAFGDVDNDGDLDMYLASRGLYLNGGKGVFALDEHSGTTIAEATGKSINDPRGAVFGDIDGDGDLDLFVTFKHGENHLFRNDGPQGHWLEVALTNSRGVAGAFGAKVWVYEAGRLGEAGHLIGFQEARSATGYCCQDPPVLHFGLGARTTCDLRVKFLEGPVIERKGVQGDALTRVDARAD